jgi:hypothetical protein
MKSAWTGIGFPSGGGRDFMRPVSQEMYGIPRDRVIGKRDDTRVHEQRQRRHDHPQGRGRLPRRRPSEADPHLEPHRPPVVARSRQLQRRHPDARIHTPSRQIVAPTTPPPRRHRPRIRLHARCRAGARDGCQARLDGRQRQERLGHRLLRPIDSTVDFTACLCRGGRVRRPGRRFITVVGSQVIELEVDTVTPAAGDS